MFVTTIWVCAQLKVYGEGGDGVLSSREMNKKFWSPNLHPIFGVVPDGSSMATWISHQFVDAAPHT
jgi:hypothetical protein